MGLICAFIFWVCDFIILKEIKVTLLEYSHKLGDDHLRN